MALKLGTSIYTYLWDMNVHDALKRVAGFGFKYIEIMSTPPHVYVLDTDQKARAALRKVLEDNKLQLISMNPSYGSNINLAATIPEIRDFGVNLIQETIKLTHDIGGQMVIVVPGHLHPLMPAPFETAWGWSRDSIKRCAETAEKYGVTIALENVTAFRFFDSVSLMLRMVDEVGSERVRLMYDVANTPPTEYAPAALHRIRDYLVFMHLSDRSNGWGHLPIGMGIIDFGAVAKSLEMIDYQGVCVLEMTHPQASDGSILASAAKLESLGWKR